MAIEKLDAFNFIYPKCPAILIIFKTGGKAALPKSLNQDDGVCALEVGWGQARPVHDLVADANGFRGTSFSFGGSLFAVDVPWESVFAMSGRRRPADSDSTDVQFRWPEDAPKEIQEHPKDHAPTRGGLRSV